MADTTRHRLNRPSDSGPRPAQRRRRRSRFGSVLILVVALLVLMALIGTAWISTARTDRAATQQHAANTEIEMLVDGVVSMIKGLLGDDLFGPPAVAGQPPQYRPAPLVAVPPQGSPDYEHFDYARPVPGSNATPDRYLAERIPIQPGGPGRPPLWPVISGPLVGVPVGPTALDYRFEDVRDAALLPRGVNQYVNRVNVEPVEVTLPNGTRAPGLADRNSASPTYNMIFLAADADGDGIADSGLVRLPLGQVNGVTYYAALRIVDNNSAVNINTAYSRDHDFSGDGGRLGTSGYGTATFDSDRYRSHTFFASRVGLAELLERSYTGGGPSGTVRSPSFLGQEMNALLKYRWNDNSNQASVSVFPGVFGNRLNDQGGKWPYGETYPVPAGRQPWRNDFQFFSVGEAMSAMLAGRLDNPGVVSPGATPLRYRPLPRSDGGALAYRGGTVLMQDWSPTETEARARVSLYPHPNPPQGSGIPVPPDPMQISPYPPAAAAAWYADNFSYTTPPATPTGRVRTLLTHSNPVSNAAPWHDMSTLPSTPAAGVKASMPPASQALAMAKQMGLASAADLQPLLPHLYPYRMPDNQTPNPTVTTPPGPPINLPMAKASVNTGEFGELWRAYWMVMSQRNGDAPPASATMMFRTPLRDPYDPNTMAARPPVPELDPRDVMLLRAAIAAVNTIDLRDPDHDVTSVPIVLPNYLNPASPYEVVVHGTEPQPYITEIFVNTDVETDFGVAGGTNGSGANPKGYVAVELYNPYPVPITLAGWTLAIVDRRSENDVTAPAPTPPTNYYQANRPQVLIQPLPRFTHGFNGPVVATPAPPIIPAGGHLVLENYHQTDPPPPMPGDPPAPASDPYPEDATGALVNAHSRPPSAAPATGGSLAVPRYFVPDLHLVLRDMAGSPPTPTPQAGGELVLLRPRKANGAISVGNDPSTGRSLYAEAQPPTPASLADFVPVDSFDFYGMELSNPAVPPPLYKNLHYVRRHGAGADAWRFVYPGQWEASHRWNIAATYPYRQEGIEESLPWTTGGVDPWATAGGMGGSMYPVTLGTATGDPLPSYVNNFQPIQLSILNTLPGQKLIASGGAAGNLFPFAAFPRNGDILNVPFIGAYRIRLLGGSPPIAGASSAVEFNSVTSDCARADDNDTWAKPAAVTAAWTQTPATATDDAHEMVGRFCPVMAAAGPAPATAVGGNTTAYDWAKDLFDYLTVQNPSSSTAPNVFPPAYSTVDPATNSALAGIEPQPTPVNLTDSTKLPGVVWGRVASGTGTRFTALAGLPGPPNVILDQYMTRFVFFYLPNGTVQWSTINRRPQVSTAGGKTRLTFNLTRSVTLPAGSLTPFKIVSRTGAGAAEAFGVEGLVNINTAPLKVLQQLPMVVNPATGRADTAATRKANNDLAAAIVAYREKVGPFTSLFDLNNIMLATGAPPDTFQNGSKSFDPLTFDPGEGWGDYTNGLAGAADGVVGDFEARFLMMNRLSNLVTTRSDTFTCYLLVQGWRGAGTPNPELVVQRRRAFMADRTGVTPTLRDVAVQYFYNE